MRRALPLSMPYSACQEQPYRESGIHRGIRVVHDQHLSPRVCRQSHTLLVCTAAPCCSAYQAPPSLLQVEILLPELWDPLSGPVYAEEGDQQRFWKLTRRFLDNLAVSMPGKRIRAVSAARSRAGQGRGCGVGDSKHALPVRSSNAGSDA